MTSRRVDGWFRESWDAAWTLHVNVSPSRALRRVDGFLDSYVGAVGFVFVPVELFKLLGEAEQ